MNLPDDIAEQLKSKTPVKLEDIRWSLSKLLGALNEKGQRFDYCSTNRTILLQTEQEQKDALMENIRVGKGYPEEDLQEDLERKPAGKQGKSKARGNGK